MPEIIPNWHPAAVHFPIALAVTATLLLLAGRLRPDNAQLAGSARLLLALAAAAAVLAAALGVHAYLTVDHDAAGHAVMTRHRDWALSCTGGLLLLAGWDARRRRAGQPVHAALLPAMLLLSGGLAVTGWLGAEMVYRHGVGVLSSAFASPAPTAETVAPTPAPAAEVSPASPPAVPAPVPALTPGEHIHRDGQRHHH